MSDLTNHGREALALYTVAARDPVDYLELLEEASVGTLTILVAMLRAPGTENTDKDLNELLRKPTERVLARKQGERMLGVKVETAPDPTKLDDPAAYRAWQAEQIELKPEDRTPWPGTERYKDLTGVEEIRVIDEPLRQDHREERTRRTLELALADSGPVHDEMQKVPPGTVGTTYYVSDVSGDSFKLTTSPDPHARTPEEARMFAAASMAPRERVPFSVALKDPQESAAAITDPEVRAQLEELNEAIADATWLALTSDKVPRVEVAPLTEQQRADRTVGPVMVHVDGHGQGFRAESLEHVAEVMRHEFDVETHTVQPGTFVPIHLTPYGIKDALILAQHVPDGVKIVEPTPEEETILRHGTPTEAIDLLVKKFGGMRHGDVTHDDIKRATPEELLRGSSLSDAVRENNVQRCKAMIAELGEDHPQIVEYRRMIQNGTLVAPELAEALTDAALDRATGVWVKNQQQHKTTDGRLVPEQCACGLNLAALAASGKDGHICSAIAIGDDERCSGEWRDCIDGEREVARCTLKANHNQTCQPSTIPRGYWPQVISGEALERAAIKFTEATRKLAEFENAGRNAPLIGILGAREEAGRRRRYLRAATYDHVAAMILAEPGHYDSIVEELEEQANALRKG